MAKTAVATVAMETDPVSDNKITFKDLSVAMKRRVTSWRKPLAILADQLWKTRKAVKEEIGPTIMQSFAELKVTHPKLSFVAFTQVIDPSIPDHADEKNGEQGYKIHKTYYALDYIRRVNNTPRSGTRGKTNPITDQAARWLKTILKLGIPEQAVFDATQKAFNLDKRAVDRLRKRVAQTEPVFELELPKKFHAKIGNVIQMQPQEDNEPETVTAMRGRLGTKLAKSA